MGQFRLVNRNAPETTKQLFFPDRKSLDAFAMAVLKKNPSHVLEVYEEIKVDTLIGEEELKFQRCANCNCLKESHRMTASVNEIKCYGACNNCACKNYKPRVL